jgi:acyl carrier protein
VTAKAFYSELENLLESPAGTVSETLELGSIVGWDSMAQLAFIAFADSRLRCSVAGKDLQACKTVADLVKLVANQVHD